MTRKRKLVFISTAVVIFGIWKIITGQNLSRQVYELPEKSYDDLSSSAAELPPCGQVCTYTGEILNETSQPFPQLYKDINCANIMRRMAYRNHTILNPPPMYPPQSLIDNFTMNRKMPIRKIKYYRPGPPSAVRTFSKPYLDALVAKVWDGQQVNTYKAGRCVEASLERYRNDIEAKRGVVIGTLQPWLEAILLAHGASNVTTLEYSKLKLEDDRLRVFTPYDFADLYVSNDVDLFEFGATFSSMEHSGLGRYTDPLNPYGDFEAMAQVWCMMKPGGMFMLGLPCARSEEGFILWNANRMYGNDRLRHMIANWELLEVVNCTDAHDLYFLRKPKR